MNVIKVRAITLKDTILGVKTVNPLLKTGKFLVR
jgi:hypothetical protein